MSPARIIRIAVTTVLTAAAIGVVTLWALAAPAFDPVGATLAWSKQRGEALAGWYASDPVAATPRWQSMQMRVAGGDAVRGRELITEYGCGACHIVPGVPGARGTVGPSLRSLADRAYIAGELTNAPGDLTRWLINPPYFSQDTAMPDLGVTEADARDMVAYLYTLGGRE